MFGGVRTTHGQMKERDGCKVIKMLFDNDHNAVERIIRNLGARTTLEFTVYYHRGTAGARSYCIVEGLVFTHENYVS